VGGRGPGHGKGKEKQGERDVTSAVPKLDCSQTASPISNLPQQFLKLGHSIWRAPVSKLELPNRPLVSILAIFSHPTPLLYLLQIGLVLAPKAKINHQNEVHGSNWFRTGSLYYTLSRTTNWTNWQTCEPEPDQTRTLGPVQRFKV